MRNNTHIIRFVSFLFIASLFLQNMMTSATNISGQTENDKLDAVWNISKYSKYMETVKKNTGSDIIRLNKKQLISYTGDIEFMNSFNEKSGDLIYTGNSGDIAFNLQVQNDGLYVIKVDYCVAEEGGSQIRRALYIDGALPFREAGEIGFDRLYENKDGIAYSVDSDGNQTKADSVEKKEWQSQYISDVSGVYDNPFQFYFSKGAHQLRIKSIEGSFVISDITVCPLSSNISYELYKQKNALKNIENNSEERITVQMEDIFQKSSSSIYGTYNRSSAGMEPYKRGKTIINMLGGGQLYKSNSWVSYKFNVKKTGLYHLTFKYKQNYKEGGISYYRLSLDGEVPFQEANQIPFKYSDKWSVYTAGDKDSWLFYLEQGTHTIRLQAVSGALEEAISECKTLTEEMNRVYNSLYVITGPNPDPFRDYNFKKIAKEEINSLKELEKRLKKVRDSLVATGGTKGSYVSTIERLMVDIEKMVSSPESIAQRLNNFVSDLGAFSEWTLGLQNQPVDFDWLEWIAENEEPRAAEKGTWTNICNQILVFLQSFSSDYKYIGSSDNAKRKITVWLGNTGRDQATLVRKKIDEQFTGSSNIGVTLQFITGALLPATLSGIGPDVYMFCAQNEPVNYALRGAVTDLSQFDDFNKIATRFSDQSLIPYTYNNSVYGLPETEQFPVMFYRADILSDLGLSVPKTWDDVYALMTRLQSSNLSFAIPSDISGYYMFLYQNGGQIYTKDGSKVALNDKTAIEAFTKWTDFFTNYKLSVSYSFINRFRTGEMPIGIADFATANQLYLSAPEIQGMWGMASVPGTRQQDGTIYSGVPITGTANIIMSQAKDPEAAWEFLKFWSQTDVQASYAQDLEDLLGVGGRYTTANTEAFSKLNWSYKDRNAIQQQREMAFGVPECPGSYIVPRYTLFAFNAVVDESADPYKELTNYIKDMDQELLRKRNEFAKQ